MSPVPHHAPPYRGLRLGAPLVSLALACATATAPGGPRREGTPGLDGPVLAARPLPARSAILGGLAWTGPAVKHPGTGTDMHWFSWAADGALYVVDGDGRNFGQPWSFGHLLRVTGRPGALHVEEVSRFDELRRYGVDQVRYVCGPLAVDGRLYVAVYAYDYGFPGAERWFIDAEGRRNAPHRADPGSMLIDAVSQHAGIVALLVSDDGGASFTGYPGPDAELFLGQRFAGLSFVNFGPGYSGVPPELGDHVYAISNDESWENGNAIYLARVPRAQVADRAAWQFYAGVAAQAAWTTEERRARPIHADPGYTGHPTMTWNPGLGRFLLAYGSDRTPHSLATPVEVAAVSWHRQRDLVLLEGPTPWGPWALVHYEPSWEGEHVAYLPQIPAAWLSEDGLEGTLMFSGDYSQFTPAPRDSYYALMTRGFRLLRR